MAKNNLRKELEALRAQVAELSAARQESVAASSGAPGPSDASPAASPDAQSPEAAQPDHSESLIVRQFDELMELLEREMRELPTITCLAVFALGILMGRHLR